MPPLALLLRPTTWLLVLVVLLSLTTFTLYKVHTHDLEKIGKLEAIRDAALSDAKACSNATEQLRRDAEKRAAEVAARLKAAEEARRKAEQQVEQTLQERPSNPNDLCASAPDLSRQKLHERRPQ